MDGFRDLEEDREFLSLREFARVTGYLPVSVRAVAEEQRPGLTSRIVIESVFTEHSEMPEIEDKALFACLQILNSKLDAIIKMLALNSNCKEMDLAKVNISDGGLRIASTVNYSRDDFMEIRLMLPTSSSMIFYIYGKVVSCEAVGENIELSIAFTDIDDDIREQIAKYVFHKQREILRKKRSRTD
ncbi:MAG: PilZ domain-containing protein [Syntrophobacteraceae bacterium]|nr:PilZ domain-containing protein [Syntrophobacteraceae bacterium]